MNFISLVKANKLISGLLLTTALGAGGYVASSGDADVSFYVKSLKETIKLCKKVEINPYDPNFTKPSQADLDACKESRERGRAAILARVGLPKLSEFQAKCVSDNTCNRLDQEATELIRGNYLLAPWKDALSILSTWVMSDCTECDPATNGCETTAKLLTEYAQENNLAARVMSDKEIFLKLRTANDRIESCREFKKQ